MLTLVYPYYDNCDLLEQQFRYWEKYSKELCSQIRVIVVDDGSGRYHANRYLRKTSFPLRLYRIDEDIPWNTSGSRNLGMAMADTEWVMLMLMDAAFDWRQLELLVKFKPQAGNYYRFKRRVDTTQEDLHPNRALLLMRQQDFWSVGGFDEDLAGNYGHDDSLLVHWLNSFRKLKEVDLPILVWQLGKREVKYPFERRLGLATNKAKFQAKRTQVRPYLAETLRFPWHCYAGPWGVEEKPPTLTG